EMNLEPRARLRQLPAPYGGWRPPLDPGRPLLLRWPALLVLIPLALALAAVTVVLALGLFASGVQEAGTLSPGGCAANRADWPEQDLEAVDCTDPDAEYTVDDGEQCAPGAYVTYPRYGADGATSYCLVPRK
ncbi:LppU/SCO3897 family protein, partial [Streptomyces boluensis]|nr:hypothetical protein [Streptomyces boluensis]